MTNWYQSVMSDISNLPNALKFYDKEYLDCRSDLDLDGKRIWDISKRLPGWMAFRYGQYQELSAIYDFLELECKVALQQQTKHYLEHYPRDLSDKMAGNYAETMPEVQVYRQMMIEVKMLVQKFEGLTKGLSALNFQLTTLAKMRDAGIEDATI